MTDRPNILPPKWPLAFLRWFLKAEYLEEIEGDMEEVFQDLLEELSPRAARIRYTWEVIRLLRPNLIRHFSLNHPLNTKDMIRHNFLLIVRNFMRYKSTFFINLTGLTIGLTCSLLALLWIQNELSIDSFHQKDEQLYQVMQTIRHSRGNETIESTPAPLADALEAEHPEIRRAVKVIPPGWLYESGILRNGEEILRVEEQYVGEDFFKVFSFELLDGDPQEILQTKQEILIAESVAIQLFGTTQNLIGKSLDWEHYEHEGQYVISGVFADPPKQSTLQFEVIFHIDLFLDAFDYLAKWGNSEPLTYVLLEEGTNVATYQKKLSNYVATKVEEYPHTLLLHRFSDRYLHGNYENGEIAGGRITYIRLFSIIAFFILLIACINFMNLSTAQASRRMKEIGVKKAFGVSRKSLIGQYLGESMLLAFLALLMAIGLTLFLLPGFNNLLDKQLVFSMQGSFIWAILGLTLFTGLVAGMYPAFYLSSFQAVNILKGLLRGRAEKGKARRALVVFQFCISVLLIVSALVVYQQTQLIQSKNLGYNRENIIYFNNDGPLEKNNAAFLDALNSLPGVKNASNFSHDLTGDHGGTSAVSWKGKDPEERIGFSNIEIGYNFIETVNIEMVAGRAYSKKYPTDTAKIIFNEAAIKAMGLEDPIGQTIRLWGEEREIIGVAKDFHYESLYHEIMPCFLLVGNSGSKTMIKLATANLESTLGQIKDIYHQYSGGLPLDFHFLDEDYQAMYQSEKQMGSFSKYFCAIAIFISCLGLFGLMAFSAERRRKEMGIRKILGAGPIRIIYLLSQDATRMVLLGIIVALPLSYWLTSRWLDNFAFSIQLKWWFFLGAGLIALLIAWTTVGIQSLRTVRVNPAETLRQGD